MSGDPSVRVVEAEEDNLGIREKKEVLTVPEVAQRLRIGRTTAYDLVGSGRLRSVRVGPKGNGGGGIRVPVAAVDEFLNGQDTAALSPEALSTDPMEGTRISPRQCAEVVNLPSGVYLVPGNGTFVMFDTIEELLQAVERAEASAEGEQ